MSNKETTLASGISSVSIVCCIVLIVSVLPRVYAGELFAWHPIFMALGFLGFMCEGILAAYHLRPSDGHLRVVALQNHMWMQVASAVCVFLGFLCIYSNKVRLADLLLDPTIHFVAANVHSRL